MVSQRKELKDHRWPDLRVASWPLREIEMEYAKQTDRYTIHSYVLLLIFIVFNLDILSSGWCSSSCGLFLLNYIEYWTGDELSDNFTQVYYYYLWHYACIMDVVNCGRAFFQVADLFASLLFQVVPGRARLCCLSYDRRFFWLVQSFCFAYTVNITAIAYLSHAQIFLLAVCTFWWVFF
jgi:hypothetical protein